METELTQSLTFLAWTGGGFLIIVGLFIAKLLFDLSRLTVSLTKSADIVQKELGPIMKNVGETASTVNNLVQTTNKKVGKLGEIYDKVSDIAVKSATKAAQVSGVVVKEVFKGLYTGFMAMIKKK